MNKLPTELFRDVFNYLRPIDLAIFSHTNSRNNIITNNEITHKFKNWDRFQIFNK